MLEAAARSGSDEASEGVARSAVAIATKAGAA